MPFWVSARACAVGSQRAQCSSSKTQATRKKRIAIRLWAQARPIFVLRPFDELAAQSAGGSEPMGCRKKRKLARFGDSF